MTFQTHLFENKVVKPHFINPICFGEDVAAWMIARLPQPPFVVSEPIQEDYGWGFWARVNDEPYWTAIAIVEDTIGQEWAEWMVSVNYEPGFNLVRRFLKRPREENLLMLCRALDAALHAEPSIRDIQWWRDDFYNGEPSAHPH
ncbi:MAG: hypothetical protein HZC41_06420 [Chloroflexi bacterium]|nr:hypothetical protein [Chloroflexota bacterium]